MISIFAISVTFLLAFSLELSILCQRAPGAEALRLREGISFVQDTDNGFPIVAEEFDDALLEAGVPAFIFFGASADINTNRQAKRVIDLYNRFSKAKLKFILIDVDHPSKRGGVALVKKYYRGYIPFEVIINAKGEEEWSQIGEVESPVLHKRLEQVL